MTTRQIQCTLPPASAQLSWRDRAFIRKAQKLRDMIEDMPSLTPPPPVVQSPRQHVDVEVRMPNTATIRMEPMEGSNRALVYVDPDGFRLSIQNDKNLARSSPDS